MANDHNFKMLLRGMLLASAVAATIQAADLTGLDSAGQIVNVTSPAAPTAGFQFVRLSSGVQIHLASVVKNVLFYEPGVARVNTVLGQCHTTQPSLVVVKKPDAVAIKIDDTANELIVSSAELQICISKATAALTFCRPDGTEISKERADKPSELKEVSISGAPTYDVKQTFTLTPDESLYGLGQYNRPYMDYRGQEVLMVQTNIGIVVPMMISTKRYGILWDIYSKSTFVDNADGATFWAESAPAGVDYYFIAGQNMDGVISGYRRLTGAAPMYPKAAFGLLMSKERYQTQNQLLQIAKTFREKQFPMDYMVQDWQYWGTDHDGFWSGMIWDKTRYPDPAAMTRTLHNDLHAKLMISIWPSIGNDTELAHELDAKGLRFAPLHWISKQAKIYDAYSADGRKIYFKYIKKGLLDVGVDALWMDGTEVEVGGACHDPNGVEHDIKNLGKNAMGDFTRYLNPYSLLTTEGTYEGQRATSDQRVVTLTRSAWAGQQRYAAMPWSGDTTSGWDTLHAQIAGGLNVGMAGLPYWTQDTGGFFINFPGGTANPEYRELFARWNQFAIFNPVYRIHGTNIDREPYRFESIDSDVYKSLLDAAHLRYRLMPYLYSLGWMSTDQGYTMMRGLAMDFPDDQAIRKTDDAFMFGPAFLVHPVTRPMYHASDPPAMVIPADALRTPDGQPGLAGEYFAGRNFESPAGKVVDATVDHDWPGPPLQDIPAGLKSLDDFSARWEGTITASEDGNYEIGIEGDDGYRLFLDGKLAVEDWRIDVPRYKGAHITLTHGQKLAVKIEYFQAGLGRICRLKWKTPSQQQRDVDFRAHLNNLADTYLPKGADWYDFWTGQKYAGGQLVQKACPINILPLYVRAGSIVPMGPVMQYATERPDAPYEIRVYAGADADFTIYEDDNETYQYEKGERATVPLHWNDKAKTLTIGARKGSYPGLVKNREYRIIWMSAGPKNGVAPVSDADSVVRYDGTATTVQCSANAG